MTISMILMTMICRPYLEVNLFQRLVLQKQQLKLHPCTYTSTLAYTPTLTFCNFTFKQVQSTRKDFPRLRIEFKCSICMEVKFTINVVVFLNQVKKSFANGFLINLFCCVYKLK